MSSTWMTRLPHMSSKKWKREIGPLQLVSHVAQIRHTGEQEKHSAHIIQNDNSFACLSPVHPWLIHLLSSVAVMYHVNG